jgi:hypothetical protein
VKYQAIAAPPTSNAPTAANNVADDVVFGGAPARGTGTVAGELAIAGGDRETGAAFAGAGGMADTVGVSRSVGVGCAMAGIVADEVAIGVRCAGGSAVSGGNETEVTARGTAPVGRARGGVVINSVGADDA